MIERLFKVTSAIAISLCLVGCFSSSLSSLENETSPATIEETTTSETSEETTTTEPTDKETSEESSVESEEETEALTEETTTEVTTSAETTTKTYILNTNTKKIHSPNCSSVKKIKDKNKAETTKTIEELEKEGYEVCQVCYAK